MGEGFESNDAHAAIDALRPVYDPRRLRIGQAVTLTYVAYGDQRSLAGMRLATRYDREAVVGRLVDGVLEDAESDKQLAPAGDPAYGATCTRPLADGSGEDG